MSGIAAAGRDATSKHSRGNGRAMMARASMAVDVAAVLAATFTALALRGVVAPWLGLEAVPFTVDWPLAIPFLAVLGAYATAGLYERDAYMSRPLHGWTIAHGSGVAFVVSAAIAFLIGSGWFNAMRSTVVLTFVIFPAIDAVLRLGPLHRLFVWWVGDRKPIAYVVGDSTVSTRLTARISSLRGFADVRRVDREGAPGSWTEALGRSMDDRSQEELYSDSVFVDSGSLSPREVLGIIETAQERGVDVYVASGLLEPLEGSRLLKDLFQTPMTRVRRTLTAAPGYALKRTLDVLGSSLALLLLSPIIAVVGLIIKVTSPGPVFLTQTRVGRSGSTFGFLKFRSMYVDSDSASHEAYVKALINGEAKPTSTDGNGNGVFHIVDDPRVTPIGRFIRKYSLDEIPQLWNVLRGDMSLVGPRPPLPYEAAGYDEWQKRRLEVQSGVTGVWQVVGRNRVSFDEMTFQDLMYGMNTGFWVDLRLCLRTIPAALVGGGL